MSLPEPFDPTEIDGPPVDVNEEMEFLIGRSLAAELNETIRWKDAQAASKHDTTVIAGFIAEPEHGRRRWEITCDDDAEWCMARLLAARTALEQLATQRDAYIDRAQRAYWRQATPLLRDETFFETHLQQWGIAQRVAAEDEARRQRRKSYPKTFHVPSGRVETTAPTEPKVMITDPEAVTAWARDHCPQAVSTTYSVKVTDLRPHVEITPIDDTDDSPDVVVPRWIEAGTDEVTLGDPTEPVPGVTIEYPTIKPTVKPDLPLE